MVCAVSALVCVVHSPVPPILPFTDCPCPLTPTTSPLPSTFEVPACRRGGRAISGLPPALAPGALLAEVAAEPPPAPPVSPRLPQVQGVLPGVPYQGETHAARLGAHSCYLGEGSFSSYSFSSSLLLLTLPSTSICHHNTSLHQYLSPQHFPSPGSVTTTLPPHLDMSPQHFPSPRYVTTTLPLTSICHHNTSPSPESGRPPA